MAPNPIDDRSCGSASGLSCTARRGYPRKTTNADQQNRGAQGDANDPEMGTTVGGQERVVHSRSAGSQVTPSSRCTVNYIPSISPLGKALSVWRCAGRADCD